MVFCRYSPLLVCSDIDSVSGLIGVEDDGHCLFLSRFVLPALKYGGYGQSERGAKEYASARRRATSA